MTNKDTETRAGGYFGSTMNVGQLRAYLAHFPDEMPVTLGTGDLHVRIPDGCSEWLNVAEVWPPLEDWNVSLHPHEVPSVILCGADDFDARQW